ATATTRTYTHSLHDALPIFGELGVTESGHRGGVGDRGDQTTQLLQELVLGVDGRVAEPALVAARPVRQPAELGDHHRLPAPPGQDRKSTRLNSSHVKISYAV